MEINGIATLRCWPVTISLAGSTYTIPAKPALVWILAIHSESWLSIIPGMLDQSDDRFDRALDAGLISADECVSAAQNAIAAASGLPWWAAWRLIGVSIEQCGISGSLVLAGIDAESVSLGAYVAAIYRIITKGMDKKELAKIDRTISERPAGIATDELYDEQVASDAFMNMARARGMKVD
jgi:hypothetical protein